MNRDKDDLHLHDQYPLGLSAITLKIPRHSLFILIEMFHIQMPQEIMLQNVTQASYFCPRPMEPGSHPAVILFFMSVPRPTQFEAEVMSLCPAVFVTMVAACLTRFHVCVYWLSRKSQAPRNEQCGE